MVPDGATRRDAWTDAVLLTDEDVADRASDAWLAGLCFALVASQKAKRIWLALDPDTRNRLCAEARRLAEDLR